LLTAVCWPYEETICDRLCSRRIEAAEPEDFEVEGGEEGVLLVFDEEEDEEEDDDDDEEEGDEATEVDDEEEELDGCGAAGEAFFLKSEADTVPAATAAGTCVVKPSNPHKPDDGTGTVAFTNSFAGCNA
jgi:hypothetical protein